ncbi:hypothetical protein AN963_17595 [Brevibacillus choshinensis]|uniref:Uncharacterized protein n=1 Tax=Brevibacillus choshinensis TaxID=54911 RepID=A0ABR5N8E3_BRECH|nr:hypothetical protein [Brevibacillus choshinensis]KQL46727.1 hypothetical protein AN963_17595 [Brevibacillus choshinensis]
MKKRMAMTVMALAVSAMAGSAFAADEPTKTAPQNTIKAQLVTKPAISLEQMAKEKGITVEELIAQLKKEGKLKVSEAMETFNSQSLDGSNPKEGAYTFQAFAVNDSDSKDGQIATATTTSTASFAADEDGKTSPMMNVINLEDMAKEKGITVEELVAQLEKEGKITNSVAAIPAVMDLEKMAKEKGITVEELIAQLQKEGKLAPAATLVPATPVQK